MGEEQTITLFLHRVRIFRFTEIQFLPKELVNVSYVCQGPQDETWTDFDGPSWIQYDLFRKNNLPGSRKVNLAKFILPACQGIDIHRSARRKNLRPHKVFEVSLNFLHEQPYSM